MGQTLPPTRKDGWTGRVNVGKGVPQEWRVSAHITDQRAPRTRTQSLSHSAPASLCRTQHEFPEGSLMAHTGDVYLLPGC